MLAAAAGLVAAGDVPTLTSMETALEPVRVCQPPFVALQTQSACPGFTDPQIAGMVPGDAQALCFHLGCCWHPTDRPERPHLGRGLGGDGGSCVAADEASPADTEGTMYWAGNQPIPSLSNTRGVAQLPLETADPLAVDCIYFPPFFGTCDGSRSDSRDDRANKVGPVIAGKVFLTRALIVTISDLHFLIKKPPKTLRMPQLHAAAHTPCGMRVYIYMIHAHRMPACACCTHTVCPIHAVR